MNNDYSAAIETLPYGYARHRIVIDAQDKVIDYVFVYANMAFENMTGLQRQDIIGRTVTAVLPGIDKNSFDWIQAFGNVARGTSSLLFEQYSEPLGRWYEGKAYSDQPDYFTTVFTDITARRQMDNARRCQSEKMSLLLQASKAMVAEREPSRLAQIIVDGIARLTRLKATAIYMLHDKVIRLEATSPPLPPGFPEQLRTAPRSDHPHISQALATKSPVIMADSRRTKLTPAEQQVVDIQQLRSILYVPLLHQGEAIGVLIASSVQRVHTFTREEVNFCETLASHAALSMVETRMAAEQRRYIAEINQKNRDLEQAEKAARESERKAADILRCAEDVSFVITDSDPQCPRIVDFSPGAERIFGYQRDEVLGKEVAILHTADDIQRFPAAMAAMRNRQEGFAGESTLVRKNGQTFPALFKTHPLFDDENHMYGTFGVTFDISELKQTQVKLADTLDAYKKSLHGMVNAMGSLMGKRDHYTAEHQVRVAKLAVAIGEDLGLDAERIEGLGLAAAIHDVGKVAIPAEILTKPGTLSKLEYQLICTHPLVGSEILQRIDFPWPLAEIVRQHHEKTNGSGYPEGLADDAILLEARILCVADVVESMSSHRPYRPALGVESALDEIQKNKGVLYDGRVVDACLRLFANPESAYTID